MAIILDVCHINAEGFVKVAGSHFSCISGNVLEIMQINYIVTPDR